MLGIAQHDPRWTYCVIFKYSPTTFITSVLLNVYHIWVGGSIVAPVPSASKKVSVVLLGYLLNMYIQYVYILSIYEYMYIYIYFHLYSYIYIYQYIYLNRASVDPDTSEATVIYVPRPQSARIFSAGLLDPLDPRCRSDRRYLKGQTGQHGFCQLWGQVPCPFAVGEFLWSVCKTCTADCWLIILVLVD